MAHLSLKFTSYLLVLAAVAACAVSASADGDLVRVQKDTLVTLKLTEAISTRESTVGQQLQLTVANDVYSGMTLIIPAGTATTATIAEVAKPRSWGRSGKIALEFGSVNAVDGTPLRLAAWTKERAEGKGYAAGATLGGAALLGPVGLVGGVFVKGKHVEYPAGHEIPAAVAWEYAIKRAASEPAKPAVTVEPVVPVVAPVAPAPVLAPVVTKPAPVAPAIKAPEPAKTEPAPTAPVIAPVIPIIEDLAPPVEPAKPK